jgi:hypothetical protein
LAIGTIFVFSLFLIFGSIIPCFHNRQKNPKPIQKEIDGGSFAIFIVCENESFG